jgi:hypothetical protein
MLAYAVLSALMFSRIRNAFEYHRDDTQIGTQASVGSVTTYRKPSGSRPLTASRSLVKRVAW